MPRFTGDSFRNSQITVDYVKDTVVFNPVGEANLFGTWFLFMFSLFLVPMNMFISFFTVGAIYLIIAWRGVDVILSYEMFNGPFLNLLITGYAAIACSAFYISLPYFIPSWRKNHYPKVMAMIDIIAGKRKTKIVNPATMLDNRFIIPMFRNVMLQYELRGEFARYIQSVRIENLFLHDEYKWMVIFQFKKKPMTGQLKVHYV